MKNILTKLFKSNSIPPAPSGLPENNRIYCVGDIHGRHDLLLELHNLIKEDALTYTGTKTLIYLGDYIDRGSESKQVIDCLLSTPFPDFKSVYLLGNHEQVLLQFLHNDDPSLANDWFKFGGIATLISYGVEIRGIPTLKDIARIRAELSDKIPITHLDFYKKLNLSYESGNYFFVHAGIKPKLRLEQQKPEDMLWIREEFLNSKHYHSKIIVHGHTVTPKPEHLSNRIGIDTGAYSSGKLTCAVFENLDCKFIQTGA